MQRYSTEAPIIPPILHRDAFNLALHQQIHNQMQFFVLEPILNVNNGIHIDNQHPYFYVPMNVHNEQINTNENMNMNGNISMNENINMHENNINIDEDGCTTDEDSTTDEDISTDDECNCLEDSNILNWVYHRFYNGPQINYNNRYVHNVDNWGHNIHMNQPMVRNVASHSHNIHNENINSENSVENQRHHQDNQVHHQDNRARHQHNHNTRRDVWPTYPEVGDLRSTLRFFGIDESDYFENRNQLNDSLDEPDR